MKNTVVPVPFSSFNLHPLLDAAVAAAGYAEPTPIQVESIPAVMAGRDVLGQAKTGSGKTAAFVLPILNKLLAVEERKLRVLVVVPTRELAEQILDTVRMFASKTNLSATTIYGGVSMEGQIRKLNRGVDIVIGCPGRLLDHMQKRTIDLSAIDTLVLDEADQMFDMGFLPNIRRILKALPQPRQTLLFSATMPPEIRSLALEILREPTVLQVDRAAPTTTVSHSLYPVRQHLKTKLIVELLKQVDPSSVIIFTRTKHRAKRLASTLVNESFQATSLQGNLSQSRRRSALEGFRDGKYGILVATDIASRGLDISGVSHVINYDIPNTVDTYTHRIGRTGRAAQTGTALTLISSEDEGMVRSIEHVIGSRIERRKLESFDYQAAGENEAQGSRGDRPQRQRSGGRERHRSGDRGGQRQRRDDRPRHSGGQPRHSQAPHQANGERREGGNFEHHQGERRYGPRQDGPRRDGPRQDGPRREGQFNGGQRSDEQHREAQRREGLRHEGQRHDGPRHDGPRHERSRRDGPRYAGQSERRGDNSGQGPRGPRNRRWQQRSGNRPGNHSSNRAGNSGPRV